MVRNKAQPVHLESSDNEYDASIQNFKNLDGRDIGFFDQLKLGEIYMYINSIFKF